MSERHARTAPTRPPGPPRPTPSLGQSWSLSWADAGAQIHLERDGNAQSGRRMASDGHRNARIPCPKILGRGIFCSLVPPGPFCFGRTARTAPHYIKFRVPKFWGAEFLALRCPSEPRWSAIGLQTRFLIHSKPIEQGPHPLTTTECHGPTTRGPKLTLPKGVDS